MDVRHGDGELKCWDGYEYKGNWKNDKPCGQGKQRFYRLPWLFPGLPFQTVLNDLQVR